MPGKTGFNFYGASQSLMCWLSYCSNISIEKMEMTTPVITRRTVSDGEKMEMTTPVITRRVEDQEKWKMSFVMPSKYGAKLPAPKDSSVEIREVPKQLVDVAAFSGISYYDMEKGSKAMNLTTATELANLSDKLHLIWLIGQIAGDEYLYCYMMKRAI